MENYRVKFNKKAYQGKSKPEFIEEQKHLAKEFGIDLSAEYDKMFPQEAKKADSKEPAKKEKTE